MYWIRQVPDYPLSVAYLTGDFDRAGLMAEIDRAYRVGDIVPGQSRCVVIDRDFANAEIPIPDLILVQEQIRLIEQSASLAKVPCFVSVFVSVQAHHSLALEMYLTLWAIEKFPAPRFHVTETLNQAEDVLKRLMPLPETLEDIFTRTIPVPICPHALAPAE